MNLSVRSIVTDVGTFRQNIDYFCPPKRSIDAINGHFRSTHIPAIWAYLVGFQNNLTREQIRLTISAPKTDFICSIWIIWYDLQHSIRSILYKALDLRHIAWGMENYRYDMKWLLTWHFYQIPTKLKVVELRDVLAIDQPTWHCFDALNSGCQTNLQMKGDLSWMSWNSPVILSLFPEFLTCKKAYIIWIIIDW